MKETAPVNSPPDTGKSDRYTGIFRPSISGIGISVFLLTLLALAVLVIITCMVSKTPGRTLFFFFLGPFRTLYSFGSMLNSAVPLIMGGLGVSIAMRTGNLNLGGEGQIYSGAFVAASAALPLANAGFMGGFIAVLAGAFFAGAVAALSGVCKARWGANELITSFLLSNVLILIVNYLIGGPFLDTQTNLQSTVKIPVQLRLPVILPSSNLSAAFIIAVAAALIIGYLLKETKMGYEFSVTGANEIFARYGGINTKRITVLAMFLSGILYGLAGALAVFGVYYAAIREFTAGLGWSGLAAALVAAFNPIAVIPAGIFFAWISSGAKLAMQNSDITFEIASIVQSVIFFLITSTVLYRCGAALAKKRRHL